MTATEIAWKDTSAAGVQLREFVHNGIAVGYGELPDRTWLVMRYDLTDPNATLASYREPNMHAACDLAEVLAQKLLGEPEL